MKIKLIKNNFNKSISEILKDIFKNKNLKNVILTGGNTFKKIYQFVDYLDIDINKNFYFSDERCVNEKSYNSNFYNVKKHLFDNNIKNFNVHRINAFKKNKNIVVKNYIKKLPKKFDVMFLSLGSDGHLASIFDLKDANINSSFFFVKHNKFNRISVGTKVINKTKKIFILVKGRKKGLALKKYLNERREKKSKYQLNLFKKAELLLDKYAYKSLV